MTKTRYSRRETDRDESVPVDRRPACDRPEISHRRPYETVYWTSVSVDRGPNDSPSGTRGQ
ncbi:hypothetical protein D8S78_16660 [Natrialba swarupiae]|nr:hypothetical protein [Natrialba swarupiae]